MPTSREGGGEEEDWHASRETTKKEWERDKNARAELKEAAVMCVWCVCGASFLSVPSPRRYSAPGDRMATGKHEHGSSEDDEKKNVRECLHRSCSFFFA